MMVSRVVRVSSIGVWVVSSISIGAVGTVQETSISLPLAKVVVAGGDGNALGHGINPLGDGVQASAGAEGNSSIGQGVMKAGIAIGTKTIGTVQKCVSISFGLNGSDEASQQKKFHLVISTEQRRIPM